MPAIQTVELQEEVGRSQQPAMMPLLAVGVVIIPVRVMIDHFRTRCPISYALDHALVDIISLASIEAD